MDWKEFLKPTVGKVLTFLVFILLFNGVASPFGTYSGINSLLFAVGSYLISCAMSWNKFLKPTIWKALIFPIFSILFIFSPSLIGIYWYGDLGYALIWIVPYLMSCAIMFKFGNNDKSEKTFLKPTFQKIAVFLVAYLALLPVFLYPLCIYSRFGGSNCGFDHLRSSYMDILQYPIGFLMMALFGGFSMNPYVSPIVAQMLFIFAWAASYLLSCFILSKLSKKKNLAKTK